MSWLTEENRIRHFANTRAETRKTIKLFGRNDYDVEVFFANSCSVCNCFNIVAPPVLYAMGVVKLVTLYIIKKSFRSLAAYGSMSARQK